MQVVVILLILFTPTGTEGMCKVYCLLPHIHFSTLDKHNLSAYNILYRRIFLTIAIVTIFAGAVFLSSVVSGTSEDPDNPCSGDRLVYTCTSTDGVLAWRIGGTTVGAYIGSIDNVGQTLDTAALPGVVANFTTENGTILTSTLTIPPAGSVVANESNIVCTNFAGNVNSTVLRIIGEYFCYNCLVSYFKFE